MVAPDVAPVADGPEAADGGKGKGKGKGVAANSSTPSSSYRITGSNVWMWAALFGGLIVVRTFVHLPSKRRSFTLLGKYRFHLVFRSPFGSIAKSYPCFLMKPRYNTEIRSMSQDHDRRLRAKSLLSIGNHEAFLPELSMTIEEFTFEEIPELNDTCREL
ncbi:hypothetical protein Tco_0944170 [Tanacetum coccineum]